MSPKLIKIVVINDIVCPFCYIGHQELKNALERCSDLPVTFDVEYRPFQLITSIGESQSISKEKYYNDKYGVEVFANQAAAVKAWGDKLGIDIGFKGGVINSTVHAQRLIMKAYQLGGQRLQQPLLNAIFVAFYTEQKDVSDVEVLSHLASSAGVMSTAEAAEFLKSDELTNEILKLSADAKANGVKGVPVVIIDGKWAIHGGQPADTYIQVFHKLAKTVTTASTPASPMPGNVIETSA